MPIKPKAAPKSKEKLRFDMRDYFAASVMAEIKNGHPKGHKDGWDGMAAMAYSYAEAMIRARSSDRIKK